MPIEQAIEPRARQGGPSREGGFPDRARSLLMVARSKTVVNRRRSGRRAGRDEHVAFLASERAFAFLEINRREEKPRTTGLTEIRGPILHPTWTAISGRPVGRIW